MDSFCYRSSFPFSVFTFPFVLHFSLHHACQLSHLGLVGHHLHHLACLVELLDETVDLLEVDTGTLGYAVAA